MNIILWILQVLSAAIFLAHGVIFINPPASMKEMFEESLTAFRRFVGITEILAAIGLILPGMLNILTWFTPLAASGLTVVMVGAVIFHISRREVKQTFVTALLLVLVIFVAYMRWQVLPL